MNEQRLARLEAHLERLVEGAFAQIFGKRIRAQDIALELARKLEENIRPRPDSTPEAPDYYIIFLNPDTRQAILQRQPALPQVLSEYVVELASQAGCKLINTPIIDMQEEPSLGSSQFIIKAEHSGIRRSTTALMERIAIPASSAQSHNPQMVINGQRAIQIEGDIVNIGRSRDNHIVIEDASVSRYHLQLRLRHGRYMLFDTQSQSGTFVNDVAVKQHVLQNSDVIRIGSTHIVYTEDTPPGETTGIFPVIDPDQPEPLD